jgi:hypothetical protein
MSIIKDCVFNGMGQPNWQGGLMGDIRGEMIEKKKESHEGWW